jgi:CRISPR-associated protein Csm1
MEHTVTHITRVALLQSLFEIAARSNLKEGEAVTALKEKASPCFSPEGRNSSEKELLSLADEIITGQQDRLKSSSEDRMLPLQSVFNRLRGAPEGAGIQPESPLGRIGYPASRTDSQLWDPQSYKVLFQNATALKIIVDGSADAVNAALFAEHEYFYNVPAFPGCEGYEDLSLSDYVSLRVAISSCLALWLETKDQPVKPGILEQKTFLLCSCDFSGIQKFIYLVSSDSALRSLRARSFYLELLMEHITDEILERVGLTRANLLYSGGGRNTLLLPNTARVRETLESITNKVNHWLFREFGTLLYLAEASVSCSGRELSESEPLVSLFHAVSQKISLRKMQRYSAEELVQMNRQITVGGTDECCVCGRSSRLNEAGKCPLCAAFADAARRIMRPENVCLVTADRPPDEFTPLPLPNCGSGDFVWASAVTEAEAREWLKSGKTKLRMYVKNRRSKNFPFAIPLEMGDYCAQVDLEALAGSSKGIPRIGILRLDVDSLGDAFSHGFDTANGNCETLFRTKALSRELSRFFQYDINLLMRQGNGGSGYKVEIVYSGGDDVFLAGAWSDIVKSAVDIHLALEKYTLGRLTISGGIGIYPYKYPISNSAQETAELEDAAKKHPGKNAIDLFSTENTFSWNVFTQKILSEKLAALRDFFENQPEDKSEFGNAFLYRLLQLLRGQKSDQINLARYAYLLARMEPAKKNSEAFRHYNEFSSKMYQWAQTCEDRLQLIAAICIFVYAHRRKKEEDM